MDSVENMCPLPPAALRSRVSGSLDEAWFDESGRLTVGEWSRALACQGVGFGDFQTIIDFGCGCGRALRHLKTVMNSQQRLIGLDPDGEAIGWVRANLGVEAYALDDLPPAAQITTGAADLILSHSVFTHLPEDVQFAWLSELARMLRPGGILIASIHGTKVVEEYTKNLGASGMLDAQAHVLAEMNAKKFFHVVGKNAFEEALPAYYGAAFHDISYIADRWSEDFEIKAWFPTFALKHQDVLVLQRR